MSDDDLVFVTPDQRVTRGEYRDRLARAVTVLRELGVGPGGGIGVALQNCPQFYELIGAASVLGAKAVPVAWRKRPPSPKR